MTNITAALVKDLRDKTGAGMMDCKNALTETGGDMEAVMFDIAVSIQARTPFEGARASIV